MRRWRSTCISSEKCSILVTCRDLAMMRHLASMAAIRFPDTGVFDVRCVKDMLSIMFTCGMR